MFLEINLKSKELLKNTQVNVILPNDLSEDSPCKVLWLLHGLSDDYTNWMRNTAIERHAGKYNLAVIMPSVDRSWYTNTKYGMNYFNYITKELPALMHKTFKGLSKKREDNIIGGLSMGGYGALKSALTFPEKYGYCISLSGALDITMKGRPGRINEWKAIFGYDMQDSVELEGSEHDLFALAKKANREGKQLPEIYMWCGLDDGLLDTNYAFDKHLSSLGAEHYFGVSEGNHSWQWWDLHIQNALAWVFDGQTPKF